MHAQAALDDFGSNHTAKSKSMEIEIVNVDVGPNSCSLSSKICIDIKYVSKIDLEGVTFVAKVGFCVSCVYSFSAHLPIVI